MNSDSPSTQQLSSFSREKTDTLLLIFTCTFILLPFAEQAPAWVSATAILLIMWRVWLTVRGQVLPPKWLLIVLTGALSGGLYLHFQSWFGKDVGIAFLIILACLKMLEMHARRDAIAVIFVCYFLLVGQLLYSQSLLSAAYVLLCICFILSTQFAFQYHQLVPPFWTRLMGGFKIVALAIPLMLILFLLFPRTQGPLWGNQQSSSGGITGLSNFMEPGNVVDLALSEQIAFRVKFFGPTPSAPQLYWRAIVLDTYDGKRWTESLSQSVTTPVQPQHGIKQEILMEPHSQRWLFGLDRPIGLNGAAVQMSNGNDLATNLTNYEEIRSSDLIQDRIRYTVTSSLDNVTVNSDPKRDIDEKKYLQLPIGSNPVTTQWTQQLRLQSTDPTALAKLVLDFMRDQPFRYTLSPPPLGKNQVDDFMFRTQAGFCEHYASSFVVVMRNLGVPARVVTGYQGGEINPIDGLMTVRQADAHAWAEIWVGPQGWKRVDPVAAVAPDRIEHGLNGVFRNRRFSELINFAEQTWLGNLVKEIQLRWDATNSAWNLWVLNYNLSKQKNLLSSLVGIEHPQAVQVGMTMMMIASFIAALLSLLLLRKQTVQSSLDKLYLHFCKHMRGQGLPRADYEGPFDYGQRLQLVFPGHSELIEFLSLYTKCKYGKGYNSNLETIHLKTLLKLCLKLKSPGRSH